MSTLIPMSSVTYGDDQLITVPELAELLRTTPAQVYKQSCHAPHSLPPRVQGLGRRLVWHLGTCKAWIRARIQTDPITEAGAPRIGRPRAR